MKPFDVIESPLEGINLIEASAGTGKTHQLTSLYLRLLVDRSLNEAVNFNLSNILVLTFTEAATKELKGRIGREILRAITDLSSGNSESLIAKLVEQEGLHPQVREKYQAHLIADILTPALHNFDEASIFTIHGFCRKALADNAFESAYHFQTQLISDDSALIEEIVRDFWRRASAAMPALFVSYLLGKKFTVEKLSAFVKKFSGRSIDKILPPFAREKGAVIEKALTEQFYLCRRLWNDQRSAITVILGQAAAQAILHKTTYSPLNLAKMFDAADKLFSAAVLMLSAFNNHLNKLGETVLHKAVKKAFKDQLPCHQYFKEMDRLLVLYEKLITVYDTQLRDLKQNALLACRDDLVKLKNQKIVLYFHDLLVNLSLALCGFAGRRLRTKIARQYPAVLVDEFQDTDPLQYSIFKTIYSEAKNPLVFFIGDPKQSIYSFRGADIYTYLKALKDADQVYSLSANWRSDANLIKAVNTLFTSRDDPFFWPELEYLPVRPAAQSEVPVLYEENQPVTAALRFWCLASPAVFQVNSDEITKTLALDMSIDLCVREIYSILDKKKLRLKGRAIAPQDIAVLVRKNWQARQVKEALGEQGIPAVLFSNESVFETKQAQDLGYVLQALTEIGSTTNIATALATDICGFNAEGINGFLNDSAAQQEILAVFAACQSQFYARGFFPAIHLLFDRYQTNQRMLACQDGERTVTNLLHLAELLHNAAVQNDFSLGDLCLWFDEKRCDAQSRSEDHEIRLESDLTAVRIVTVHKSKGLEYPIVFCPFLWDEIVYAEDEFIYHDNEAAAVLDLGSAFQEQNRQSARQEELAENLRLLYVSLTRAKNLCYVVWGKIKNAELTGLSYLLHPLDKAAVNAGGAMSALKNLKPLHVLDALKRLALRSANTICLAPIPGAADKVLSFYRNNQQQLTKPPRVELIKSKFTLTSFTGITRLVKPASFLLQETDFDFDFAVRKEQAGSHPAENSIFAFPRGAGPGIFFHALFEKLDFTMSRGTQLDEYIRDQLSAFNYQESWFLAVRDMVAETLAIELEPGLSLGKVPQADTLREVGFLFTLNQTESLRAVWATARDSSLYQACADELEKIRMENMAGFLKGFIDLVFCHRSRYYIVDWKSNYLGPDSSWYSPFELNTVMAKELYFLQYLIYTVALDLYLRQRIRGYSYEKDFGGVYYLFLRGIDSPERRGIYFDKPKPQLIDKLRRALTEHKND